MTKITPEVPYERLPDLVEISKGPDLEAADVSRGESSRQAPSGSDEQVVWVEKGCEFKSGEKLTEDLVIDEKLAQGVQAFVFELKKEDGDTAEWLLKVAKSIPLISDLEREWKTGQVLKRLALEDGTLVGFMKVGPAVREKETKNYRGLLMERLAGQEVMESLAKDTQFFNVHYTREMLLQIFVALDEAQRAFGFHHADLRLSNVFENNPEQPEKALDAVELIQKSSARRYRPEVHFDNPKTQFKVIDYGLAKFDESLAADPDRAAEIGLGSENLAAGKRKESFKMEKVPKEVIKAISQMPEAVHQQAWRRKGDIYHILFDLAVVVDGRVWPEADRVDVELLLALIFHVTGVRLRAYFAPPDADFHFPFWMRWFLLNGGRFYFFRQATIRLVGWLHYNNAGISAAEALTRPFFRVREIDTPERHQINQCRSLKPHPAHETLQKRRPITVKPE